MANPALAGFAQPIDGRIEILVDAIFAAVVVVPRLFHRIGRAEIGLRRAADARLVLMLDDDFALRRKGLLPVERRLQRPARREMLLHALADVVFLDSRRGRAGEVPPISRAAACRAPRRWRRTCGASGMPRSRRYCVRSMPTAKTRCSTFAVTGWPPTLVLKARMLTGSSVGSEMIPGPAQRCALPASGTRPGR